MTFQSEITQNPPPFFFFIGNSGAGKDTAISMIEKMLETREIDALNIKRYITRPPHESEDFHSIDVETFKDMADNDEFAFYWKVYNTYYGYLQEDIEYVIENDILSIFNISRSLIPVVRSKYPWCKFIKINAPINLSKQRVKDREREDEEQKRQRIRRMTKKFDYPDDTIVIQNDGSLDELKSQLEAILRALLLEIV